MAAMAAGGVSETRVIELLHEALGSERNMHHVESWVEPKIKAALASEVHRQLIIGIVGPSVIEKFNEHATVMTATEAKVTTLFDEAKAQFARIGTLEAKIESHMTAADQQLQNATAQLQAVQAAIQAMPDMQNKLDALAGATTNAQQALVQLNEDRALNTATRVEVEQAILDLQTTVSAHRDEANGWASRMQVAFDSMIGHGGSGKGGGSSDGGKGPSIDKKEVSVWKLPDKVDRDEFRHWKDTVDANLEAVHKFPYPDLVLEQVRRQKTEVNAASWPSIMAKVKAKIPHNIALDEARANSRPPPSPPGMGYSGGIGMDAWASAAYIDIGAQWDFTTSGRFLWTYLLGKLNTDLHGKSVGIEDRNGLELYRLVVKSIDDIPENAKFMLEPS